MNRWTGFYVEDPRVLSATRSICSEYAASKFREHDCSSILDLVAVWAVILYIWCLRA